MMKEFDPPMICISQEEYDQLQQCRIIVDQIWQIFGPYRFPKEFREARTHYPEKYPVSIETRFQRLQEFDDSE